LLSADDGESHQRVVLFSEIREYPRSMDIVRYRRNLVYNLVLLVSTLALGAVANVNVVRWKDLVVDAESVIMGVFFGGLVTVYSRVWAWVESWVPGGLFLAKAHDEIRATLLAMYGRDTNRTKVFFCSVLRSLVVSVAQACLFRGLAINAFLARTNDVGLSILGAACVSAVAHLGVPGAAFFPDLFSSLVFGIVYGSASYNLVVTATLCPLLPLCF